MRAKGAWIFLMAGLVEEDLQRSDLAGCLSGNIQQGRMRPAFPEARFPFKRASICVRV